MMDPMEFNFIDKRVIIEVVTGSTIDGKLLGADQDAFYIKDEVAGYYHKKIVYKKHVTSVVCVDKKIREEGNEMNNLTPPPGMGVRIF